MVLDVRVNGVDAVLDLLSDMPDELFNVAKKQISKSAFNTQRGITRPMKLGQFGLQSRTGNLARSIQVAVTGNTLDELRGRIFTDSVYAPIHETGGTVTAKSAYASLDGGPFLNIPSSDNKTGAGVMRETARSVFAVGGFIIKISAPKAKYAVLKGGKVMFWLVKSVKIQATLGMRDEAEDEVPTLLSNLNSTLLEGV